MTHNIQKKPATEIAGGQVPLKRGRRNGRS